MTIRIFVGSDERSDVCDAVLEHSIRKHCSTDVEITFMRSADKGLWHRWPAGAWYTRFSGFRYTVPEAAGFEGHAIYMDSDMMVHRDLSEVCPPPHSRPVWAMSKIRLCFAVFDCAAFRGLRWWPTIEHMKRRARPAAYYRGVLNSHGYVEPTLPPEWNSLDLYQPGKTAVTHFTRIETQPWKPWPESCRYVDHSCPAAVAEFWRLAAECGVTA